MSCHRYHKPDAHDAFYRILMIERLKYLRYFDTHFTFGTHGYGPSNLNSDDIDLFLHHFIIYWWRYIIIFIPRSRMPEMIDSYFYLMPLISFDWYMASVAISTIY